MTSWEKRLDAIETEVKLAFPDDPQQRAVLGILDLLREHQHRVTVGVDFGRESLDVSIGGFGTTGTTDVPS